MAAVSINTGGVCHEDKLSDTPREQWPALLRERRMYIETQFEYDCRCIVQYLAEAEEFHAELGYDSADDMIQQELLIRPEWVRIAVDWLTQQDRPEPVTKAEVEVALQSHGGDRRSEEARKAREDQVAIGHLKPTNGLSSNSRDRIKARLLRDHPEIAAALDRGEHPSARAAAIAAGIIKPVPTVRLVDDPAKVAAAIRKHLTPEQLTHLVQALLA